MARWRIYRISQITTALIFKILNIVSRLTLGLLFFRIEAKNKENILNLSGPLIVTPNHKTFIDHFFVLANLPFNSKLLPARGIAIDWLFKIKILGWVLKNLLGAYPTYKGQGLDISLRDPLKILLRGYVVGIYPEGGIRFRPGVHPVKIGAAYLAVKSKAPILPVAIIGAEYFSFKTFFFGRRKIKVVFGKPYYLSDLVEIKEFYATKEEFNAMLAQASEIIKNKIEELYNKNV